MKSAMRTHSDARSSLDDESCKSYAQSTRHKRYSARVLGIAQDSSPLVATPLLVTSELEFRRASGFELRVRPIVLHGGESLAVRGASGSGKSTLLSLLCGELLPQRGSIQASGVMISTATDTVRRKHRATGCGQVFQTFELVDALDVLDNVLLPFRLHASLVLNDAARARALELLERVGLRGMERRSILTMSHGERQRVAIARALVTKPSLVLADEPTGSLDTPRKRAIADLLLRETQAAGAALIIATHDQSIVPLFGSVLTIGELE